MPTDANIAMAEVIISNVVTRVGSHPNKITWDYEIRNTDISSITFRLSWGAPSREQTLEIGRRTKGIYRAEMILEVERPHHDAVVSFYVTTQQTTYYTVPQVNN